MAPNLIVSWLVNKLIADHLPCFSKICKESKYRDPFGLLKSVDIPIRDIDKCKKEYQEYAEENNLNLLNPFGINYVDGMNICAGEAGKGTCIVSRVSKKLENVQT